MNVAIQKEIVRSVKETLNGLNIAVEGDPNDDYCSSSCVYTYSLKSISFIDPILDVFAAVQKLMSEVHDNIIPCIMDYAKQLAPQVADEQQLSKPVVVYYIEFQEDGDEVYVMLHMMAANEVV